MKRKITEVIKVRVGIVLEERIESGAELGWSRAHKHTDKPDKDTILAHVTQCVLENIAEHFSWL